MKNILLQMKEVFSLKTIVNVWHMLFRTIKEYKCVAYISETDVNKDKVVEAFEIKEFSKKKAYDEAYEILKLKYPGKGFDIRISNK